MWLKDKFGKNFSHPTVLVLDFTWGSHCLTIGSTHSKTNFLEINYQWVLFLVIASISLSVSNIKTNIPALQQLFLHPINNLLRPIIDEIYELNNGLTISTPEYPHGRKVVVNVVTLVDDIVAAHKAAGFKSHSANKFCSWCEVNASDQHKLKLGRPSTGRKVLEAANHWKDTLSEFSQEKVAIRTGVRWSELNRLPYWDLVLNVSLGVMHNWFKGVLQHHLRNQWGFDCKQTETNENSKGIKFSQQSQSEDSEMVASNEIKRSFERNDENSGYLSEDLR
ncbi:hypothetical protein O181_052955 [Austropuccinia psidii MF-1]|uniref:Uncharacterized protein n=1 Tax=Austropuccinia psidii MF-1 TaxID=1389203 RepID=A0A9Q3DZS4_9BASI|nr:hypothetical protein [Austropuccinia psidii MF-1]